jgi:hypothetical protein
MERGACRRALVDYRTAVRLVPGGVWEEELRKAECCATAYLSVSLITEGQVTLDPFSVGDLTKELRNQLDSKISEYVRWKGLGASVSGPVGDSPCPSDKSPARGPYRASVEVTSVSVLRTAPTASSERIRTIDSIGGETVVSYKEYTEPFSGVISGWVKVMDTGKDAVVLSAPVRSTASETGQWMGNAVSVISQTDPWTRERKNMVVLDSKMLKRTRVDEQRREARKRLMGNLIRKFAEEASTRLLDVVDTELPLPDPEDLPIL